MPLRSLLALLAFGAIAATGVITIAFTGMSVGEELSLLAIMLLVAVPLAIAFSVLASAPLERERSRLRTATRGELQASVRRFGEALRSTAVDSEGEPDLAPLLQVVLETAITAVGGRRGVVYRYDQPHRRLDPASEVDVPDVRSLELGQGLAGWIAAHRANLLLPATSGHPEPAPTEPLDPVAIGVPLETSDDLLGVLIVHGRAQGGPFADHDLQALTLLANQASTGAENVLLHHEARRLSVTDALTGLANVRAFRERLAIEFERAVRFGRPLSLAIVDIDHFKQINDRFGHQRGDSVLADLAARMVAATRGAIDLVARYGGEEFALLLPETDPRGAAAVAEKVRLTAAQAPFAGGEQHLHATVSVGFATFPEHAADPESLIQAADLALYEAKRDGRNRVGSPTRYPQRQPES